VDLPAAPEIIGFDTDREALSCDERNRLGCVAAAERVVEGINSE
jgi:hypothetical protein